MNNDKTYATIIPNGSTRTVRADSFVIMHNGDLVFLTSGKEPVMAFAKERWVEVWIQA